jgi:pimeloyl-ACP methyl ester carboxylesterase
VTFGLVLPTAVAAPGETEQVTVAQPQWGGCGRWLGDTSDIPTAQCATVSVPVDYGKPGGNQAQLAVIRVPAGGERVGVLMINPGGPGASAVDNVAGIATALADSEITRRFDLVGFDPRGVARSTALRCFGSPRQWEPAFQNVAFPLTPGELEAWIAADRYLVDACDQRGGRIIDHMATAVVARDMDRLRAALGDDQLTYAGVSYGSYLGVTYANLFHLSAEKRTYDFSRAVNTDPTILVSTDHGNSWSFGGNLLTSKRRGYVNGYPKYASNGVDRIDFVTTEHHPRDFNNSIYHGYVQTGKLHRSDGTVIDENVLDGEGRPSTELTKVFAADRKKAFRRMRWVVAFVQPKLSHEIR